MLLPGTLRLYFHMVPITTPKIMNPKSNTEGASTQAVTRKTATSCENRGAQTSFERGEKHGS
jgi:hypothetical protein